ncbi:tetratricopeptide repeat protein [Sulfurimonas sp. ST-27]|uniref:tetratricopeptide repeat protein n=1 Tax=Sulfurimonas sp. ST-27 TaxID=3400152 RepID=UPI003AB7CFF8
MTKTFRLFISSTFSDFQEERALLQTKVFPKIKEYAIEQGYSFQPIDLRWGVSNEAQLDQKTLELCLSEVQACKTYPHPNFLIMIGNRYGWVPLPYAIEKDEFEELFELLNSEKKEYISQWYKLDLNNIPPSYILQERVGEYVKYETWVEVEDELRDILQTAVNSSKLDDDKKRKYFLSATEAEVEEGIISYNKPTPFQKTELLKKNKELASIDPEHIFGFIRDIEKNSQTTNFFYDENQENVNKFKERLEDVLIDENLLKSQTKQKDEKSLENDYLNEFEKRVYNFLRKQIDEQKKQDKQKVYSDLEVELQAQQYFATQKRKNFLGQEDILKKIDSYISDNDNTNVFVLYGESGKGKSAIISKAVERAETKQQKKVFYRFVGATAHSNSTKEILVSIFDEMGISIELEDPEERKNETFEEFSERVYDYIQAIKDDVVIFIDAIDQIQNEDYFLWLPQKLPHNVKIIISALDDEKYEDDSKYFATLKEKTSTLCYVGSFEAVDELLTKLLALHNRRVDEQQKTYFLEQYNKVNSPLYINIAVQEMKNWKSGDTTQKLSDTQVGIISEFINNLTEFYHHNADFVSRVLGYIYASRDGLSESELLTLLAQDKAFIKEMAPEDYHKNPNKELPLIHWSRLQTQLSPFFRINTQDNEDLIYFFHREFEDIIAKQPNQQKEHESVIKATQTILFKNRNLSFNTTRWGKLYASLITEYYLRYDGKEKQKEFCEFLANDDALQDEWLESFFIYLNDIGINHYKHNRMHEALAYAESNLQMSAKLYNKNPDRWVKDYTKALSNLASSYQKINRIDDAMALEEKFLEILEDLYSKNPDRWAEGYTTALNSLAISYKNINRIDDAIVLEKKSLETVEALYNKDPDRLSEAYAVALNHLASSYREIDRIDDAIVLGEKILEILEDLYSKNPDRWVEAYTITLNTLALSYREINRIDDAMALEEKSLEILEDLYSKNPDRWVENYTKALSNLASSYQKINRIDDAMALEEKFLEILEDLYSKNPDRWVEDYTTALNNLAISYKNINRIDDAIVLGEKSLEILEELYSKNPDRWSEGYTRALSNLAVLYQEIDRIDDAIVLGEKSLEIREILYSKNPDRWAEAYTIALHTLASSYREINRMDDAVILGEKFLEIREILYSKNPDRWAENYTVALNYLAGSYREINRMDDAIVLGEKSLEILEELYSKNPDRWAEGYTRALNNLAVSYKNINRIDDAIVLGEKSLEIREELYSKNPDRWAEGYTTALGNLAFSYKNINRMDDAIALEEKSLEIQKELYSKNPDRWAENYTTALGNLAFSYKNINRMDDAIALEEKSLEIQKELYSKNPDRWAENYTTALGNLAISYKNINRMDDAIALEEKSLEIREELYSKNPDRWAENYTIALNNLAASYKNINRMDDAIVLEEKFLEILEELYSKNPDRWSEGYTIALSTLAVLYQEIDRIDDAVILGEKSLEILEELYSKNPDRWAGNYTTTLNNLAISYKNINRMDDAIALEEKSLEIQEELYSKNPDRLAGNYTTALNNLAISFHYEKKVDKVVKYAKILIAICEEHNMQNTQEYKNAIQLLDWYS